MNLNLTGKVAIITGSTQGIGLEIAATYAKAGATVVINHYGDRKALNEAAERISDEGGEVVPVIADVTRRPDVEKLISSAFKIRSTIDILVNNAGGLIKRVSVADFDEEHFQKVIDVNLKSAFLMSSGVIPVMKKQKSGRIINLSSQAAHDGGGPGAAAYSASKGAVWTFTKSLAKEVGAENITVNALSPGFIAHTSFHDTFTAPEVHEKVAGMVPLRRLGAPEDVAGVALFMASDLSKYMTGQTIEVNGGLYMP